MDDPVTLLDGPVGTELERRGLALPAPAWTARAVSEAPELLAAIHADYAAAGADVHTAATFRTTATALAGSAWGGRWEELARRAVALCRGAVGSRARVAGSIAPLMDCYSPELTSDDATLRREHAALAACLADAGCDLLLVETMPTLRELRAATAAAVATGLPVWAAVTTGPRGDFFDAAGLRAARDAAQALGAQAFLLNCLPPDEATAHLPALAAAHPARPALRLGAYANATFRDAGRWTPEAYAAEALRWRASGAAIIGGCCGTGPDHIRALRRAFATPPSG
jgi:S-methylmethionine-dependent homocysteine/selenocysteine methylase